MDMGGIEEGSVVSEVWQGPDWWLATDAKWYPPELHPNALSLGEDVAVPNERGVAPLANGACPGPGWWLGTDDNWYPPDLHPKARPDLSGGGHEPSADGANKRASDSGSDRWNGHPVLSALVSGAIFVVPITLSIVAATVTAHTLPRPRTAGGLALWWIAVLCVPSVVLLATDRLARRAMPLAVLLKMTMVFPDRAPKRLAVVRMSGSTRNLARRVEEARTHGIGDEPVVAAEKILALAGALNAHDRLTRGHGERVRVLTDLIAEELGLSPDDRDRLRWSALLHDIGKLTVHPEILNKADQLDDEEWEVIKTHPLEGARLTAPLADWLGEWGNTIAEHHEKYDGSGYPYGLRGEEISLGGRIVAVADCYDTMTTVRSYKTSMSPKSARAELAACAGSQFDPRVVRAFLDVSIGRLRPVAGPLAWLGSLPFLGSIPQLGQTVAVLSRVGAASLVVTGAVAAGQNKVFPHQTVVPVPSQVALPFSGTPAGSSGINPDPGGPSTTSTVASAGSSTTKVASAGSSTTTTTLSGGGGTGSGATSTTTTTISVPAAPSTPTGVTAAPGDGNVRVSWVAPDDGGSPITSYTVTRYKGDTVQARYTSNSSATSHLEKGLTNGTTYTFTVAATNAIGSSPPSAHSPEATPLAPTLNIVNGGALAGSADGGDQVIVLFSPAPSPSALCAGWTATSYPDLDSANVVVHGTEPSSGDDTLAVTDTKDCKGGFHFGTIDLGQRGYFTGSTSFGGNIAGCGSGDTIGCSIIHFDGRTLTITLGTASSEQPVQTVPSVAVYSPAQSLGSLSDISNIDEENF